MSNTAYRGEVLVMYIKSPTFEQIMLGEEPQPRYLEVFLAVDEALVPPLAKSESNFFVTTWRLCVTATRTSPAQPRMP